MPRTYHERNSRYKSGDIVKVVRGSERGSTHKISSVERSGSGQILYNLSSTRGLFPASHLRLVKRRQKVKQYRRKK